MNESRHFQRPLFAIRGLHRQRIPDFHRKTRQRRPFEQDSLFRRRPGAFHQFQLVYPDIIIIGDNRQIHLFPDPCRRLQPNRHRPAPVGGTDPADLANGGHHIFIKRIRKNSNVGWTDRIETFLHVTGKNDVPSGNGPDGGRTYRYRQHDKHRPRLVEPQIIEDFFPDGITHDHSRSCRPTHAPPAAPAWQGRCRA